MKRGNAEDDALHALSDGPRTHHTKENPRREQPQAQREELRPNMVRLRTERQANADFVSALSDGVTEDAVCSNGRKEQRDAGDDPSEYGRRATRDKALRDPRLHRPDVIDRQLRISFPHQVSQRIGKRFRALTRARHHEDVGVLIVVRHVNRTLPLRVP